MTSSSAVEDERLTDLSSDLSDEEHAIEQPEELRAATPRPVYSDEQLHQLVEYIQRMTMLYALNQRDWHEKALDIIRRWLLEVNEPLLTISYGQDKLLTACLGLPSSHVMDLSYFRRDEPNLIFKVEGFHDEINFGTIHSDVDGCLANVLENIYMPFFRNFSEWNSSVRLRFCSSLDRFLAFLTGVHCKIGGMTVLYVPYVMKQLIGEGQELVRPDRQLVKSLEAIAVFWTTQIRTLLGDRSLTVPHDLTTVQDEFDFWQYRYEVLQGINTQLTHPDVRRILKVLRQSHSVHMPQIEELIESANRELLQSLSNIKYLHLLIGACEKIDLAPSPNELPKLLPRIIHLIRFIWLNSEYYTSDDLITGLFRNLSNQIISYCTDKAKIEDILMGQPRFGLKICNVSIDCCLIYKKILEEMSKDVQWQLDMGIIFNHIDAFVERLNDVSDICESMIVFGRLDEFDEIPKPQFGGSRGEELAQTADAVEQKFLLILKQLQHLEGSSGSPSIILNVHCEEWYDRVADYRKSIQQLEETIQRLIYNVFQRVCNVEEALEAQQTMIYYSYRHRGTLRKTYLRQVSLVWQMFSDEMDFTVRHLLEQNQHEESWLLSKHVSRALNYRLNLERLSWLKDRLKNAEWLPVVKEAIPIISKFDLLKKEFNRAVRQSYEDWQNNSTASILDLIQRFERYLLIKPTTGKGKCLLQCNIDPVFMELCDQAQHFERFGFAIPAQMKKLHERADYLRWLYNSLVTLCLNYNHIILLLTERERKLFRPLIQECDRQLAPCQFKLTYNSELSDDFFKETLDYIENVRDICYIYKRANREIKKLCEQICDLSMLHINFTGALDIAVFEEHLISGLNASSESLTDYYNHIVELLFAVSRQFQSMRDEMSVEWFNYVNILDDMLATAFMTSSRSSLSKIFDLLHCDPQMAPASVLVMESDIKEGEIVFTPTMSDIGNVFNGIIDRIQNIIDQFPRLGCKLKLPNEQQRPGFAKVFREDQECKDLVQGIKGAINQQSEEITKYVTKWNQHSELWKTSERKFIETLKASARTAQIFEGKIEHYSSRADDISFVDAITNVHFVLINQNAIKSSILDWIEKWQALNIQILLEHSSNWMRAVYRYMRRNERQVMQVPRTQRETLQAKAFYERLVKDVPIKQASFSPLLDLFVLLHKYQVELSEKTRLQVSGLESTWLHYLQTLIEADGMLDMESDEFKFELTKQMDKFKLILKEFQEDYYAKVPSK
ncbi:LOW QUALITY PROTEIN: uncharacterized protein [Drosophila tropicalis]|uniref:LOW QUALITY PROTEIN: uncharacterized protein n=1 Tax=Drosophila tropicalis TaxID=46794 RepID=UPI0035AB9797